MSNGIAKYYVYALKDPRTNPVKPFYIGKGPGNRAWEHTSNTDTSKKGELIKEIIKDGYEVVVSKLVDNVTEEQSIKIEAELIAALGTVKTGGLLTNAVIPSGEIQNLRDSLKIPSGIQEKASIGLNLLKEAVIELAKANTNGVTNAECAKVLGLQSNYRGASKDYLSYSLLGLLLEEGKLERDDSLGNGRHISLLK